MNRGVATPTEALPQRAPSSGPPVSRNETRLRWLLAIALTAAITHTAYRAAHLGIEYYDGYEYLMSARALTGDPGAEYERLRPPFVPIVQMPAVLIARTSPPAAPVRLLAPHITSATVSVLSAGAVFWLLSRSFGSTLAALGALLFMATRYFVHYAPHVMADIPSAGWAAASTALYLRARDRRSLSAYAACGLALGAGVLTKFPLAVLGPGWVFAEFGFAATARRIDIRAWIGMAIIGAVSIGIVLAVEAVVMRSVSGSAWFATLGATLVEFATMSDRGAGQNESWSDYGAMSVTMMSLPTLMLCGIGILLSFWRRDVRDLPQLASLVALAGTVTFVLGHNEARYMLPAVPFILHFALRSLEAAQNALQARWNHLGWGSRGLALTIGVTTLGCPLAVGLDQAHLDADPIYSADLHRRASQQLLAARRGDGRLLWNGKWHTLRTRWAGFVPYDEYLGVFHFTPSAAGYFLDQKLKAMLEPKPKTLNQLAMVLRDGDAVLRISETVYNAQNLPPDDLPPMEVWASRRLRFQALGGGEFADVRDPGQRISLRGGEAGATLAASSLTGSWQVLLVGDDAALRWHAGTVALQPGSAAPLAQVPNEQVQAIELFQLERTRIE